MPLDQNIDRHSFTCADSSKEAEMLGVTPDNKFSFNSRSYKRICRKAG